LGKKGAKKGEKSGKPAKIGGGKKGGLLSAWGQKEKLGWGTGGNCNVKTRSKIGGLWDSGGWG